jgi:NAD-dependent SIR2 family protein deacetylase
MRKPMITSVGGTEMNDMGAVSKAADFIRGADSLLILAGAGMGVDSGLPDFRGDQGMWKAYPALGRKALGFHDIANPDSFSTDPELAWGFYGHRLQLYRETVPHEGFQLLRRFGESMAHGVFVYTSNVDGQFQKAGFMDAQVAECHGSIHYLQCLRACSAEIWPADTLAVNVDVDACKLLSPMPTCPHCGGLARPNIMMFYDWSWVSERTQLQVARYQSWISAAKKPVIIEIGAGTDLPTIRRKGESLQAPMVRINPVEADIKGGNGIGLKMGALEALKLIARQMDLS